MNHAARKKAVEDIRSFNAAFNAIMDLLRGDLKDAQEQLEVETEVVKLFHAQGRVAALRELITVLENKK